jgi:hypothetical protein
MAQQIPIATLNLIDLQDSAINALYTGKIEPVLQQREVERISALRAFWRRLVICGLLSVGIGFAILNLFENEEPGVWAFMVCGVLTWIYAWSPVDAVAKATKAQALQIIADAIGCSYSLTTFAPDGIELFKEMSLLPGYDRAEWNDRFAGVHHGCAFAFFDGHLEEKVQTKNGTSWKTVFRGQLICIDFPKKFLGTTVVRRDAGFFNFLQRKFTNLQHVSLPDSRLEKAFEVYASDQVEARYLIHPVFMERLLDMEAHFKGERLRCAFFKGKLLIAIEGGDKFEIGSMFRTLLNEDRVRGVLKDLAEIMKVIEAVLTAETAYLPE